MKTSKEFFRFIIKQQLMTFHKLNMELHSFLSYEMHFRDGLISMFT